MNPQKFWGHGYLFLHLDFALLVSLLPSLLSKLKTDFVLKSETIHLQI